MANNIEKNICQAVDIIVKKAVSDASFDRTIEGIIDSLEDPAIGKYRVKYQDNYFYATSDNINIQYPVGTTVQILVPGNDMSKNKTIIGSIKGNNSNFANIKAGNDIYNNIGNNVISANGSFALCSYRGSDSIVLYERNRTDNKISINENVIKEYFKNSNAFALSGVFQTILPKLQRRLGNYGLKIYLNFVSHKNENELKTYAYTLDTHKMISTPYTLVKPTEQKAYFAIDSGYFDSVEKIEFFIEGFPANSSLAEEAPNDIAVSKISLNGAVALNDAEMSGYYLGITTPDGFIFESDTEQLTLKANIKINGSNLLNTSGIQFYWFQRDASVTSSHKAYQKNGGAGWRCLNDYAITNVNEKVQWFSAKDTYVIKRNDIVAQLQDYKCVAIYNEKILSKEITIKNPYGGYLVSLETLPGTEFSFDNGQASITCSVSASERTGAIQEEIKYFWTLTDFDNSSFAFESKAENYGEYQLDNDGKIVQNIIEKIPIKNINNNLTYSCSAYRAKDSQFLGSASVTLFNNLTIEGSYSLVINQGSRVFKYNQSGLSPASESLETPISIPALTFSLYDGFGNEIVDFGSDLVVEWRMPIEDTLLEDGMGEDNYEIRPVVIGETVTDYRFYKTKELKYQIANTFNINKSNNDIVLNISYQGLKLSANTNLTFTKEGLEGTNGTEITCRIVPKTLTREKAEPIVYFEDGVAINTIYLEPELWENGIQITEPYDYEFSLLGDSENQIFTIEGNTLVAKGPIEVSKESLSTFENIVRVKIIYHERVFYATLPIITAFGNHMMIKEKGFNSVVYDSAGRNPQYDTEASFEVSSEAGTYEGVGLVSKRNVLEGNKFRPSATYDGATFNNAVLWISENGSSFVHFPIHFMLNRYGISALNDWDGNTVDLGPNSGVILAPQIGAGHKNDDNTFTGVVMGTEKTAIGKVTGLLGYNQGQRSILLDAETGKAEFGRAGVGQIIIDPSTDAAVLKSGNYSEKDNTGLEINLSKPSIRYGSGHFSVDENGNLTAKGGGTIAGWEITDDSLVNSKENVGMASSGEYAFWAKDNFTVSHDGAMVAKRGEIAGWEISENELAKNGTGMSSANDYSFWAGAELNTEGNYDKGTSKFSVTPDGYMKATSGQISGWNLSEGALTSGNVGMNASYSGDGSGDYAFWAGNANAKSAPFSVTHKGYLKASAGNIAGWEVSRSGFSINKKTNSDGTVANEGMYIGSQGLRVGNIFSIDSLGNLSASGVELSGKITASSGEIGGWKIDGSSISAGKLKLNSNGSIDGTNWSANGGGVSSSSGGWSLGSGGASYSSDKFGVDGQELPEYVKGLVVDTLDVNTEFTFQGKTVKWQEQDLVVGVVVSKQFTTKPIWILTSEPGQTLNPEYVKWEFGLPTSFVVAKKKLWLLTNNPKIEEIQG